MLNWNMGRFRPRLNSNETYHNFNASGLYETEYVPEKRILVSQNWKENLMSSVTSVL